MKAIEFPLILSSDKKIEVPDIYKRVLEKKTHSRVLILIDDDENIEKGWSILTTKQFMDGYDDSDSIYDNI